MIDLKAIAAAFSRNVCKRTKALTAEFMRKIHREEKSAAVDLFGISILSRIVLL